MRSANDALDFANVSEYRRIRSNRRFIKLKWLATPLTVFTNQLITRDRGKHQSG